jgi:hypothetical protein
MRRLEFILGFRVRAPHGPPADACPNECIYKPQLQEITKAQRDFFIDWLDFALPDSIGMPNRSACPKIISLDPSPNFPCGDTRQSRRFRHCIQTGV